MTGRLEGLGCRGHGATGIAAAAARRFVAEGAHVFVIAKSSTSALALGLPFAVADLSEKPPSWPRFAPPRLARSARRRLRRRRRQRPTLRRRPAARGPARGVGRHVRAQRHAGVSGRPRSGRADARPAPDDDGRRGSIVLDGERVAFDPAPTFFGTHAYAAAKAAIIGLARSAAATYVGDGIRVNVVAPALRRHPDGRPRGGRSGDGRVPRAQAAVGRRACSTPTTSPTPPCTSAAGRAAG